MSSAGSLGARSAEGHLDEGTVEALADGQPVPEDAADHAETCDACAARVAEAAERSAALAPAFAALAARVADTEVAPSEVVATGTRVKEPPLARAPGAAVAARAPSALPGWSVPAALALIVLTSLPELWSATEGVGHRIANARVVARAIAQGAAVLIGEAGKPTVAFAIAFAMAATGITIAVLAGRGKQTGTNGRGKHGIA